MRVLDVSQAFLENLWKNKHRHPCDEGGPEASGQAPVVNIQAPVAAWDAAAGSESAQQPMHGAFGSRSAG